jgi:hypothetical protein
MKHEELIAEFASLLDFIHDTRDRIGLEHDKFQVALTNTLRLLDEGSPIITKMKGNVEDLKAYLIRESTEIRKTSLDPYEQLITKIETIQNLIQPP